MGNCNFTSDNFLGAVEILIASFSQVSSFLLNMASYENLQPLVWDTTVMKGQIYLKGPFVPNAQGIKLGETIIQEARYVYSDFSEITNFNAT